MKKIISMLVLVSALFVIPNTILAQQGQDSQQQDRVQDPVVHDDNVVVPQVNQVQNQIKTQNAGEDSQLNVNTQESLQTNADSQDRGDAARQNMSNMAQKVEELLEYKRIEDIQGGIGQQVNNIAQQQKQAQGEITGQLNNLESRQGLMKKLFGADQKAIKNLKQQMEQNQLRIQQLQELKNQAINQVEETQIQELMQALVEQNTALEEQIQAEEQANSVFGWLLKLFN